MLTYHRREKEFPYQILLAKCPGGLTSYIYCKVYSVNEAIFLLNNGGEDLQVYGLRFLYMLILWNLENNTISYKM
jgi:hypothetical protein